MKMDAPATYTYSRLIERMQEECEDRQITWGFLIFEVFGARYAEGDEDFKKWFEVIKPEEEKRQLRHQERKGAKS